MYANMNELLLTL